MFRELRNKVYGAKIDGFMGKARGKFYSKSKESEKSLQELYIERYDSLKRQGFSRDYIVSLIGLSPVEKAEAKKAVNTNVAKLEKKTIKSNKAEDIKKATNETIEKAEIVIRQYKASEKAAKARKETAKAREEELKEFKRLAEEKAAKLAAEKAEAEFEAKADERRKAAEEKAAKARKETAKAREEELKEFKRLAEEKAAKLAAEKAETITTEAENIETEAGEVDFDKLTVNEERKIDNFCNKLYKSMQRLYGLSEEEREELITDFVAAKIKDILKTKNYQKRKSLVLEFITEVVSDHKLKTREEILNGVDDLTLALSYCNTLQDKNETANDYTVTDFLNDVAKGKETIVK